jgi:3-hydroxybutyryl-CoA dehydratase
MALEVGSELGPWTIESVSPEKMKTFAIALDDPNPIHLDVEAVKAAGLGDRVINQGPASFGYVINMLLESVPGSTLRDLRVRLTSNVFGGDRVTAAGRVESIEQVDGERRVACSVWLDVEGARPALKGTATLAVPTT